MFLYDTGIKLSKLKKESYHVRLFKIRKLEIQEGKHLNFILNKEKRKKGKLLNHCMKKGLLLKLNI